MISKRTERVSVQKIASGHWPVVLLLLTVGAWACDYGSDAANQPLSPTEPVLVAATAPDGAGLLGHWEGSTMVEATSGTPDCQNYPWEPNRADPIIMDVFEQSDGSLDLHLVQPGEGNSVCHLEVLVEGNQIEAAPWTDPFGESSSCHFPLETTDEWQCGGESLVVWIVDLALTGELRNGDRRFRGLLTAAYDYAPPGTYDWTRSSVTRGFVVEKLASP